MDADVLETIAARLDFAAPTRVTSGCRRRISRRLPLADAGRILALGCGTGIEARALARLVGPAAAIVGLDHSPALINTARQLTADEGLADRITYDVGDAHETPYADDEFDIVTLHTVVSHVEDPLGVLREARRVVRPGGNVAVFDGDYASLTFGYPDHEIARTIEEKLIQLIVANPRVMRDMPRLIAKAGLELVDAEGTLYANIASGRFWAAAAESYGLLLARSGLLAQEVVDEWREFQTRSAVDHTFFGASNYYTYLTRRAEHATRTVTAPAQLRHSALMDDPVRLPWRWR